MEVQIKTCIVCGIEKTLTEFYKSKGTCKLCQKEHRQKYYRDNKERTKAQVKIYRESHKKEFKAGQKAWYELNKEKIKAHNIINKDKIKARQKAYYEANKEKSKTTQKLWRGANKDKVSAYKKQKRKTDIKVRLNQNTSNQESRKSKKVKRLANITPRESARVLDEIVVSMMPEKVI